jgi:anti-sigma regulatory factor (Ser/Thr protein kinase)
MTEENLQLSLPADKKYLSLLGAFVQELCSTIARLPPAASYNVELAINEAVVNVISHAYEDDPAGRLQLTFRIRPDKLEVQIRDWGHSFDPSAIQDPNLDEPHESGYGVYLIRQLMDRASYEPNTADGNLVTLVKRIP